MTKKSKQATAYRERAEQLRAIAKRMEDQTSVACARDIADSYEALARITERVGNRAT